MKIFLERLALGSRTRMPLIMQTGPAECAHACLAMISSYYGLYFDLPAIRLKSPVPPRGVSPEDLTRIASTLELEVRKVNLHHASIAQLSTPCILQIGPTHFVVVKELRRTGAVLHDPARGVFRLSADQLQDMNIVTAFEIWPGRAFQAQAPRVKYRFSEIFGQARTTGLYRSAGQILLIAIALEIFTLPAPLFLQWAIDSAIVGADHDLLTVIGLGFLLLLLLQVGASALRSWALMHFGATFGLQWRGSITSHLLRLPIEYFARRTVGDITSRFQGAEAIHRTFTASFLAAILDGLFGVVVGVVLFLYSPLLALIVLVCGASCALLRVVTLERIRHGWNTYHSLGAAQFSHLLESLRGMRALKMFQRERHRRDTWLALLVDQINCGLRIERNNAYAVTAQTLMRGIEGILVVWVGASMAIDGSLSIGALVAFNAYRMQFEARLAGITDRVMEIGVASVQSERLGDILLSERESDVPPGLDSSPISGPPAVSVKNLHFRYPNSRDWILNDVTFDVDEGESVAVVGPSGCGKTTLLNLLAGLLLAHEGGIYLNGRNIQTLGPHALRGAVGMVAQDDILFAGSVRENISFFDAKPDDAWIRECVRIAALTDEIEAMPVQYNSLIGDMGVPLSGGQRQRLLLARALYKRPHLLLLDEATSHLDIANERQVSSAIKTLSLTRIIVAHRPETIASADRVIHLVKARFPDYQNKQESDALP